MSTTQPRINGFTPLPQYIIEHHMAHITGKALAVLIAIARSTWGWQRQSGPVGYAQICKLAGINRKTAFRLVKALERRGLLHVERDPRRSFAKGETSATNVYSIPDDSTVHKMRLERLAKMRPVELAKMRPTKERRIERRKTTPTPSTESHAPRSACAPLENPPETLSNECGNAIDGPPPSALDRDINRRIPASPAAIARIRDAATQAMPGLTDEEIALAAAFCRSPKEGIQSPRYFERVLPQVIASSRFHAELETMRRIERENAEKRAARAAEPPPEPDPEPIPSQPEAIARPAPQPATCSMCQGCGFKPERSRGLKIYGNIPCPQCSGSGTTP